MGNTYEIVTRIMEAYYDKEKENKSLFNKKQTETERIENEIKKLRDENLRRLEYLNSKVEHIEQEKTEPYVSKSVFDDNTWYENKIEAKRLQDEIEKLQFEIKKLQDEIKLEDKNSKKSIENNKKIQELESKIYSLESKLNRLKEYDEVSSLKYDSDVSNISSLNKKIEQEYQRRLSELNSKLDEISKKEKVRDSLIKEMAYMRENKTKIREAFIKQKTDVRCEPVANVVGVNFDSKFIENESNLLSKLIDISKEIDTKEKIESEIQKLKLDRYKDFGRTTVDTSINREKYLYNKNKNREDSLNAELESEYWKRESEIIEEMTRIANETIVKEQNLKRELELVPKMPDFSHVYLKEMFDLKYQLLEMLREQKTNCEFELKNTNDSRNKDIDPILAEIEEKTKEREDMKNALRTSSLNLTEDFESGEELEELAAKYKEVCRVIGELESSWSKALLDAKPLDKLIDRLKQNIELINRTARLISVTDEEIKAYKTPFTAEEQEEYNRRQPAQRDRINSIMEFKKSQSDNNASIDNLELESMRKR